MNLPICIPSFLPLYSLASHILARRESTASKISPVPAAVFGNGPSPSSRAFSPIHPEPDKRGNLEYKLRILPVSATRFSRLVTQLKWRLAEGGGLAVYEIGVLDDGTLVGLPQEEMKSSLAQLAMMGQALGATCEVRRCIAVETTDLVTPFSQSTPDDAMDPTFDQATTDSPALMPYRHRSETSSKNSSAGLDNIVGLRALTNEEAARLLGDGVSESASNSHSTRCWTFEIGCSHDTKDDMQVKADTGESEQSLSEAGDHSDDDSSEDGFAFALTLSDDENAESTSGSGSGKLAKEGGIASSLHASSTQAKKSIRPINNSPWERLGYDLSTPGSSGKVSPITRLPEAVGRAEAETSLRNLCFTPSSLSLHRTSNASPSSASNFSIGIEQRPDELDAIDALPEGSSRGSPASSSARTSSDSSDSCVSPLDQSSLGLSTTHLRGVDTDGVLSFALQGQATITTGGSYKKPQSSAHAQMGQPNLNAPPSDTVSQDARMHSSKELATQPEGMLDLMSEISPLLCHRSSYETGAVAATALQKLQRSTRGPRMERRARRVAELKAKEREGEGFLPSLQFMPADSPERLPWWRFSSLSFENDVPFYDAARHGWIREIAEWLTTEEVLELVNACAPQSTQSLNNAMADSPRVTEAACHQGLNSTSIKGTTISDSATAKEQDASQNLSRKAIHRRRRKDRKKSAAAAAVSRHNQAKISIRSQDQEDSDPASCCASSSEKAYPSRPVYLPPPANAVAIPKRRTRSADIVRHSVRAVSAQKYHQKQALRRTPSSSAENFQHSSGSESSNSYADRGEAEISTDNAQVALTALIPQKQATQESTEVTFNIDEPEERTTSGSKSVEHATLHPSSASADIDALTSPAKATAPSPTSTVVGADDGDTQSTAQSTKGSQQEGTGEVRLIVEAVLSLPVPLA